MGSDTQYSPASIAIIAAIVLYAIWRNTRPRKLTMASMWTAPLLLTFVTAALVWKYQQMQPVPALDVLIAVVGGLILGAPLGLLRGKHADVRATETPGVMYLHPSMVLFVMWIVAFAVRFGIRMLMPPGMISAIVGDGLLVFATSSIIISYYGIYEKYRALEHQAGQI